MTTILIESSSSIGCFIVPSAEPTGSLKLHFHCVTSPTHSHTIQTIKFIIICFDINNDWRTTSPLVFYINVNTITYIQAWSKHVTFILTAAPVSSIQFIIADAFSAALLKKRQNYPDVDDADDGHDHFADDDDGDDHYVDDTDNCEYDVNVFDHNSDI